MRLPPGGGIFEFREVFAKKNAHTPALDRDPLDF